MRLSLKQPLLRSSSMAMCGVAFALGVSEPAQAITINSSSIQSIGPFINGSCRVRANFNFTGDTVDAGTDIDRYSWGLSDSNGFVATSTATTFTRVGTTENLTLVTTIIASSANRDQYAFTFYDSVAGNSPSNPGPAIATIPISRADLIAAGGECALIAQNTAPVANAGADQTFVNTASSGIVLPIDASGSSDADNDALSFAWTQVAGPTAAINNANQANASVSFPSISGTTVFDFEVAVTDAAGDTSTDIVRISVTPANAAPTVDAGPDQTVAATSNVSLSGTASDADNDPLTFQWTQTGGPGVTLTGDTTLTPSFTSPARALNAQVLTFQLEANDGTASTADTVEITIPANQAPIADAGQPQTIAGGSAVTLNGSGSSDPDGDAIIYNWVQTSGPTVTVSGANTPNPTFTAPARANSAQTIEFQLTVTDIFDVSSTASVVLTIPANQLPLADAGPDQSLAGGSAVTLDGTGSTDPEGDTIEYTWTQTGGPSVTLTNPNSANPTFSAPAGTNAAQVLTFQLTVTDAVASAAASTNRVAPSNPQQDTVQITILPNNAPMADAGTQQNVVGGAAVTLDGSASSDPDGDGLTYSWVQISGPSVTLSGANTVAPSFTAPAKTNSAQTIEIELTVTDSNGATDTSTVSIIVAANQLPLADAGPDQSLAGNASVTLDGSGSSDPDGDAIIYSWVQTGGPSVTLTGANTVAPSFTTPGSVPTSQVLTFQLTVSDAANSGGASTNRVAPSNPQQDTVEITILANSPPVADAGADQGPINTGETVTLNGTESSDPDGDALTYTWTQVSGTPVTLSSATSASPTFIAPLVNGNEDLVFSLVVSDGQQQSQADTVTIGIRAVGSVTVIQRTIGGDTAVSFTSNITALNTSLNTSRGSAQVSASNVAAGSYTLTAADLSASGFALTDITCNDGDSVVNLAQRSVSIALSPNEELVCTFTTANSRGAAQEAIANFLTGRNALILSHQPDLQRRIDRLNKVNAGGGSAMAYGWSVPGTSGKLPFSLNLANGQASASASLSQASAALNPQDRSDKPFDIWGEAFFSNVRLGSQDGRFSIIHVGADYRIGDSVLIGALAEFDDFNDEGSLDAGEAEGNGFLVGPYVMARLAPELFAEVRAAWGSSDNSVSPFGTFSDDFETSRALYSGSLIGQFDIGKATQIRPEVTVRYLDESQRAYVDSLGIAIPGQDVGQGDVSFRPRVHHVVELETGWTLRPYAEAEGIYTFGTVVNQVLDNGLRARVEGGLDILSPGGFRGSIGAFHDGIGADNFRAIGIHASISFGF